MAQVMDKLQPWLAALDERPRGGSRWLQDLRDGAASRFVELGFPTVRDEDWRFTNVAPIAAIEFRRAPAVKLAAGRARRASSTASQRRAGRVRQRPLLAGAVADQRPAGRRQVRFARRRRSPSRPTSSAATSASSPTRSGAPFTALNTAFVHDGAFIYVPDGVVLEQPLHLLFVSAADRRRR